MIAMSGGVDSSVAALLMLQAGYECMGVTMKLYESSSTTEKTCCTAQAAADAKSVAVRLGMPHYVFNFTADFDRHVVSQFVAAYEAGDTPNPCIECNRWLKFDRLWERARILGCDTIATGHYARVTRRADGRWLLQKGSSEQKDQSYVLYMLTQEQLAHTVFPLGTLDKSAVRALAAERGLLNAEKRDSQDICFVPEGDYGAFIRQYTGKTYPPGEFRDEAGHVLGRHSGMIDYTIGQRRGLGVAGGRRLYVQRKCMQDNAIILSDDARLFSRKLRARQVNLIGWDAPLGAAVRCRAKIRYRHTEQPASAVMTGPDELSVVFDEPQRAITTGQAVVLYDGDTVLGGGTITETEES